jgi:hypothetical protein
MRIVSRRAPKSFTELAARHADPGPPPFVTGRQNFDRHAAHAVVAFVPSG